MFLDTRTNRTREHPAHYLRQWHLGVSEFLNMMFVNVLASGVVIAHVLLRFLKTEAFCCQCAIFGAVAMCVADKWRVQSVRDVVTLLAVRCTM